MYTLLSNTPELNNLKFTTLDDALTYTKNLVVEWSIVDDEGLLVFDWVDRVGP